MNGFIDVNHAIFFGISDRIKNGFVTYHSENPEIFDLYRQFALEMRESGRTRYSSKCIMERIRWHYDLSATTGEFKVNNNYTAMYARLLMLTDPQFDDFFELRSRK